MRRFVGLLNHGIYNPIRDHSLKSFELAEYFDARSFPIHCIFSILEWFDINTVIAINGRGAVFFILQDLISLLVA
jgi:hypothetical protein